MGPWTLWPMSPRAQGELVLETGEADRPKCVFPRPLVVAIVAIVVAIVAIIVAIVAIVLSKTNQRRASPVIRG